MLVGAFAMIRAVISMPSFASSSSLHQLLTETAPTRDALLMMLDTFYFLCPGPP